MRNVLFGLVIACTFSLPARATVVEALELRDLVGRADRIVRGQVVARRAYWDDAHRRIWTDVTIRVDVTYKGPAAPTMLVRRLGGSVGGIGMRTIGEVEFADGEEVFLFVRRAADAYQTVGLAQGKLHIVRDASGARAIADVQGAKLLGPSPTAVRPLADLEREVKALVGARR